jgi:MFS family permease
MMTKKRESEVVRVDDAPIASEDGTKKKAGGPFSDPRFLFFIFALLPVRTLFAHQWLTMPEYVLRSYPAGVADRMEYLVDSINPTVIFFGVPLITALTKRVHVLKMMIIGTAVSATSTFLLGFGQYTPLLIAYFVVFSVGEALWSSRFYEYAAELAPPGRTAEYMGVASLPWFVAKSTTGLYSGFVLEAFVPKTGAQNPTTMWMIYGAIAVATPLALVLGGGWLRAGMTAPKPAPAPG